MLYRTSIQFPYRIYHGMIVCIDSDNPEALRVSAKAYDRTVAGVVSGAR